MGISCLDWSPLEDNLLAIVTKETNRLEIWQVAKGQLVTILSLRGKINYIKWSLHESNSLYAQEKNSDSIWIINYKTEQQKLFCIDTSISPLGASTHVRAFTEHPSLPNHLLIGSNRAMINLYDIRED